MNYGHRLDVRPWPVSPRQYPLSGPSDGFVYCPPIATPGVVIPLLALLAWFLVWAVVGFALGLWQALK